MMNDTTMDTCPTCGNSPCTCAPVATTSENCSDCGLLTAECSCPKEEVVV